MKRTGHVFGYQHTATGATLFALGFGVLLCTTLEAMEMAFQYRNMTAVLLMASSGLFVRRRTAAERPAG
jgi:hypothetical protein